MKLTGKYIYASDLIPGDKFRVLDLNRDRPVECVVSVDYFATKLLDTMCYITVEGKKYPYPATSIGIVELLSSSKRERKFLDIETAWFDAKTFEWVSGTEHYQAGDREYVIARFDSYKRAIVKIVPNTLDDVNGRDWSPLSRPGTIAVLHAFETFRIKGDE